MAEQNPVSPVAEEAAEPKRPGYCGILIRWILFFPSRLLQLHRIRKPAFIRWIANLLALLLNLCYWLILFVCLGGLGPTVRFVGVPVARKIGIPVTMESCSVWPLAGTVRIGGLRVDNPESFVTADAERYGKTPLLELQDLNVSVDLCALMNREIHVRDLTVCGTSLFYARDAKLGTDNVSALLAQFMPPTAPAEAPAEVPAEAPAEVPAGQPGPTLGERLSSTVDAAESAMDRLSNLPKFRIDNLNISDNSVKAYLDLGIPGFKPEFTLAQPPLKRTDYDNAALVADVRAFSETLTSGGQGLLENTKEELKAAGEEIRQSVRDALETGDAGAAKENIEDTVKELKKSADDFRSTLKGLF